MSKLFLLLGVSCMTSVVSAQTRVGSGVDSSPLQLDLVAPGIDLRSTDNLSVIQRIEDSSGKTWYIRQQGALFALYPRGVKPNAVGQDVIPPGTRWFIGIQNLQEALGISTNMRPGSWRQNKASVIFPVLKQEHFDPWAHVQIRQTLTVGCMTSRTAREP